MSTLSIPFLEDRKGISKLSQFASETDTMINLQWVDLPISRTNFHGRSIEVRLISVYEQQTNKPDCEIAYSPDCEIACSPDCEIAYSPDCDIAYSPKCEIA